MAFQKIIIVLELIDVFNHHCVENFYSADREWAREEEISIGRVTLKIESIPTREILYLSPSSSGSVQWAPFLAVKATAGQR